MKFCPSAPPNITGIVFNPNDGNGNGAIYVNSLAKAPGIFLAPTITDDYHIQQGVVNITDLLKNGLASNARISLRGCWTAKGVKDSNLAQAMSENLPNTTVTGATGETDYFGPVNGMPPFATTQSGSTWLSYRNGVLQK
jgi:hypothetical protein